MNVFASILFTLILFVGIGYFVMNIKKLIRNIRMGRPVDTSDHKSERWKNMLRIAFGQQKMVVRPVSGILHIIVYIGFIIINLEVLEIIIDGLFGTHRVFAFMGGFYSVLIGSFEVLALLVIVSVVVFWIRRNILRIQRFWKPEMKGWPRNDANIILYIETVLMVLISYDECCGLYPAVYAWSTRRTSLCASWSFSNKPVYCATLRGYGFQ